MNALHIESTADGLVCLDKSAHARVTLLAQSVILQTGPVIDLSSEACRYDEDFVFRLKVTGLSRQAIVAFASNPVSLGHESHYLVVEDSVDALVFMEELKTELRALSLPYLAAMPVPNVTARALALGDVIRLHRAHISHYQAERDRLEAWSRDNEGGSPGISHDENATRIQWHTDAIALILRITC